MSPFQVRKGNLCAPKQQLSPEPVGARGIIKRFTCRVAPEVVKHHNHHTPPEAKAAGAGKKGKKGGKVDEEDDDSDDEEKAEQEKLKKEMAVLRGVLKKIVKAGPAHREAAFEGAAQEIDTGVSWAEQVDDEPCAVEPEGDEDDDGAGVTPGGSRPKRTGAAAARKRAKPTE